jgi:hypothetical protein
MTDVEKFWLRLQPHFPNWKPWNELHPVEQVQVVQGINMILSVL